VHGGLCGLGDTVEQILVTSVLPRTRKLIANADLSLSRLLGMGAGRPSGRRQYQFKVVGQRPRRAEKYLLVASRHFLGENRNLCYGLPNLSIRIGAFVRAAQGEKRDGTAFEAGIGMRRFAHNLRRESNFCYFFARNPLKRPDSDE
jgi:hypothetical protein